MKANSLTRIGKAIILIILLVWILFPIYWMVSLATVTITQYIYQQGVSQLKLGVSSAMSVVMPILVLTLASGYIIQNYKKKKIR